jgi:Uma2 family endonuclease
MPDGDRYELVDGHLVERKMSAWSSYVAGQLHYRLQSHCEHHGGGWVFPEGTSYQCFPRHPARVRGPDGSFIRAERLSAAQATEEGHLPVAPDLAVEVLSPNDLVYEVEAKVREYREAGVRLVWVVNPDARSVTVHRARGRGTVLWEDDELDGEDVLPGFRCRVGDLFQLPPGVEQPAGSGAQP